MIDGVLLAIAGIAVVSAGVGGLAAAFFCIDELGVRRKKERSIEHQMMLSDGDAGDASVKDPGVNGSRNQDINERLVVYAIQVGTQLSYGATKAISLRVRSNKADSDKAASFLAEHGLRAGCGEGLTVSGFIETRTRLEVLLAVAGAAIGYAVSPELALLFGATGFAIGGRALYTAVRGMEEERADEANRHVSEMLEVVALGLRSGLTFDRSFDLYGSHFISPFAADCASACRSWTLGLMTREEALRKLAASYRCDELERAIESVIRSMRFGSSFSSDLEEMAQQSRTNYKNAVREQVAKAPVKMMVPTGALILPAMLLLVLGPVLLELINGF